MQDRFKKINGKEYQIQLNGKWETIAVPYGKVEALINEFFRKGGMVDPETGMVATDLGTMIGSFGSVGDIMLSEYSEVGKLVKEGACRSLALEDIPNLFLAAQEIIGNFIQVVSQIQAPGPQESAEK